MSVSFRMKMILAFAASGLAVLFLIFALGNYYVNELQKSNKEAAVLLAQDQARRLRKEILEAINEYQFADLNDRALRERLQANTDFILKFNDKVVMAAVIDASGNRVIASTTKDTQILQPQVMPDTPYSEILPLTGANQLEVVITPKKGMRDIREPIALEGGKKLGEIRIQLQDSPTYHRIETNSQQITNALIAESILLLLFLCFVFFVLWRLFSRQLKLMQKNAELDRMAYVGTLASGLAHEIRNPLSAMNVNLQVMQEELAETQPDAQERATNLAGRVQREVAQLNGILTSFLEFALPNREQISQFSMRSLIEELLAIYSEEMRQKEITWELSSPPSNETLVEADRRLIYQAIRNILVNAIQAVEGSIKKAIRVTIETTEKQHVRVRISDTGPGISPENLIRIFEVFFSTKKNGSGFGLAIARRVFEEHGGSLRAENNTGSLGASFVLELPQTATFPEKVETNASTTALSRR